MIKERPTTTGSLKLAIIRIDGGTQMRADLNEDVVAEYAQIVRDGGDFPPVVVYFDGSKYWLADGFHRYHAYRAALAEEIPADVRAGTKREAIFHSVSANVAHGLRRTNADKRKAVETLLNDKEWGAWSDREIARACHVGHPLVASVRSELSGRNSRCDGPASASDNQSSDAVRTVERNGTSYQQNTANIGKAKTTSAADVGPDPVSEAVSRAEAQSEKRAQQAENDQWHAQQKAAVPEHIREAQAATEAAIAKRREATNPVDEDGLTDAQRIAELREHIKVVEAENVSLKAENANFEKMRAQWEQGGWEKVIAGKDEEIRVAGELYRLENEDKVSWMKKAKARMKWMKANGWKPKPDRKDIDNATGVVTNA